MGTHCAIVLVPVLQCRCGGTGSPQRKVCACSSLLAGTCGFLSFWNFLSCVPARWPPWSGTEHLWAPVRAQVGVWVPSSPTGGLSLRKESREETPGQGQAREPSVPAPKICVLNIRCPGSRSPSVQIKPVALTPPPPSEELLQPVASTFSFSTHGWWSGFLISRPFFYGSFRFIEELHSQGRVPSCPGRNLFL